ncbi:hypothetical protein BKA57DRAFT_501668 [Linnemannia elongata]|nr:hypothetical protein BKA57DRAFT_501668 [Linnemannia elongata]
MQSTSATTRFLEVPELVAYLAHNHLDNKSLACLMRTNHYIYALCIPALYYYIHAGQKKEMKKNLFTSKKAIRALVRNVDFVRHLELGLFEMVYYVNCVFDYQDQSSTLQLQPPPGPVDEVVVVRGERETQEAQGEEERMRLSRRPRWLAPPDPQIRTLYPIPLMTRLTKLDLHLGFPTPPSPFHSFDNYNLSVSDRRPYPVPSSEDPRATLTLICWLLDSNPHLLDLRLTSLVIKDRRDIQLLSRAVFGLKRLQEVKFEVIRWSMDRVENDLRATRGLALAMFFACSYTLRRFYLEVKEEDADLWDEVTEEYREIGQEQPLSWEMSEDNDDGDDGDGDEKKDGLTIPRLRKEPMEHLTSLQLRRLKTQDLSENEFRSMLEHCPNLTTILVPPVHSIQHPQQLAQEIAQRLCPKLTIVKKGSFFDAGSGLVFRILEALPAHQVQRYLFPGWSSLIPGLISDDIGSMFRRQSATLREIELVGCLNIDSKAIQTILVECWALERLQVDIGAWRLSNHFQQQQPQPLCINLDDAIEYPWGCPRIQDLELMIVIPDEPLHRSKKMGLVPYYNRPPPTTLSPAETAQFQSLEALYRQIGALIGLERLTLKAVYYDLAGLRPADTNFEWNSFPGMLNLKNEETGRPGYLQLLGGLTKLKRLSGSVYAMTEETKATIGMDEVVWMENYWPALERAGFFRFLGAPRSKEDEFIKKTSKHFGWLLEQQQKRGQALDLCWRY